MPRARIQLKTRSELERMREAGRIVHRVLEALRAAARPGMSTLDLDRIAERMAGEAGARPAFKGYRGYPACLCASLNHEVVHGIPSADRRLAEGDLLKLDFGVELGGLFGDAAITVGIGRVSAKARRLADTAGECLERAIACMRPGARLSDLGAAIQAHAEGRGFSVVKEFVGHGIGRALHEAPAVPNYRPFRGPDPVLEPGMVLAVEPMLNLGGWQTEVLKDRWTAVTADGSLSAHVEHTVAIVEGGSEVLSAA